MYHENRQHGVHRFYRYICYAMQPYSADEESTQVLYLRVYEWKVPRKRAPNCCTYEFSSEKWRGREHPIVVFTGFWVKSAEEENTQLLYLWIFEWKVPRKRATNCCIYEFSSGKCRGREHPIVAFTGFRVKSVEEESTQLLYLRVFEWKVPRKRAPNCCIFGFSSEKCRGRNHPIVVFMDFRVKSGREYPIVVFTGFRVESGVEEST